MNYSFMKQRNQDKYSDIKVCLWKPSQNCQSSKETWDIFMTIPRGCLDKEDKQMATNKKWKGGKRKREDREWESKI